MSHIFYEHSTGKYVVFWLHHDMKLKYYLVICSCCFKKIVHNRKVLDQHGETSTISKKVHNSEFLKVKI